MKGILKAKGRQVAIPDTVLPASSLACSFFGHAGFPEATDSLAYDSLQKLLAVGTSDGRIKLVGKPGVESLLVGGNRSGTRVLQFVTGRGALVRVTEAGDLQLWSIGDLCLLDSLPCADVVLTVTQVPGSPYLCLGCESGALQFVQLTSKGGGPAVGVCEARGLELLPYELHADELEAEGELVFLSAIAHGEYQRLLGLHTASGAIVWDIRRQCCVVRTSLATASDSLFGLEESAEAAMASAGPARSACWVGYQGLSFATGHEMGQVLVWVIPPSVTEEPPVAPLGAELIMKIAVTPPGELAMPVRQILYIEGECIGGTSSLLIFGGQVLDQPDTLSIVSLDNLETGGRPRPHPLPWYGVIRGFALVPQSGAIGAEADPSAILVLMEGGQLVLFDLPDLRPFPLSLPLQELPDLTVSMLASTAPEAAVDAHGDHAVTLPRLQKAQSLASSSVAKGSRSSDRWRWIFDGGKPGEGGVNTSPGTSDLLLTGHKDGRVRVWDASVALPELRMTVPFDSGGGGSRLRAVTGIEVCTSSGVLAVAHDKGEVRVYQFSQVPSEAVSLELSGPSRRAKPEDDSGRRQPAGFQRLLRLSVHQSSVRTLALSSTFGFLACGDKTGTLSLTDLTAPGLMHVQKVCEQPLSLIAFTTQHASSKIGERARLSIDSDLQSTRPLLVTVSSEGSIMTFEAATGKSLGPKTSPKSPDRALSLVLLDGEGLPLPSAASPLILPWAKNGSPTLNVETLELPSATLLNRKASHKSALSTPRSRGDPVIPQVAEASLSDPFHLRPSEAAEPLEGHSSGTCEFSDFKTQSSIDEDSFLAAAAEEAESAREQSNKKHRLKSFFKGEGANIKRLLDPREHLKEGATTKESSSVVIAKRWNDKAGDESKAENATPVSSPKSKADSFVEGHEAQPTSFRSQASQRSLALSRDGSEFGAGAAFVLVATTSYLRLYPADGLQVGDRTTLRKLTLEEPVCFAAPFLAGEGAGLACLSASGSLQVYSLPGLEPVSSQPLEAILGFPWSWEGDSNMASSLQQTSSAGLDGQLALLGVGWELVRLALVRNGPPLPPTSSALFDWDLAAAAEAARVASATGFQRKSSTSGDMENNDLEASARQTPYTPTESATVAQKKGIGGFLSHVREGVVNVGSLVDNTGRELTKGIGSVGSALVGRRDGSWGSQPAPTLDRILSQDFTSSQRPEAEGGQARTRNHHAAVHPRGRSLREGAAEGGSARSELLGRRECPQAGRPGPRTADEIKVAYGRSASKRSETAGAIAAENRNKLMERGERLQNLDSKAENMANEAKDFAAMARQIRDREANRKWWQL